MEEVEEVTQVECSRASKYSGMFSHKALTFLFHPFEMLVVLRVECACPMELTQRWIQHLWGGTEGLCFSQGLSNTEVAGEVTMS